MSTTMEGVRVGHDTEMLAKARRRRFTAAEKLRVLREADAARSPARSAPCCGVRGCTPRTPRPGARRAGGANWPGWRRVREVRTRSRSIPGTSRSSNRGARSPGARRGSSTISLGSSQGRFQVSDVRRPLDGVREDTRLTAGGSQRICLSRECGGREVFGRRRRVGRSVTNTSIGQNPN